MRKICSMILLCALLLALSCPVEAAQSGSCGEAVSWRFENGVLVLSGTGAMENYTDASGIPWCDLRDQIISVTVEEGITGVGDMSFSQCGKLVCVSLPSSLERIGKNAFWGCRKLESVVLPEKLTELESGAFFQCASLSQISIPAGITVLEQAVFAQCEHLDMVVLHDRIVGIERDAFSRCYTLKHIALPMSLERIETHAFFGCAQLQQLTFPQGFARIGAAPFYGCVSLKTLSFLGSAPELHEKAFLDIEAEIFYSMHDRSWDTAVQSGYGGNITWTKECFHEYTVTTTPPGCLTEGYSTYECSLCADSYRDLYIPALGHDFANYISNGDATCTEDGTKTALCTRCDATDTITDTGSAKGHAYGDWYVTKEAECETEGRERRDCKNCGYYETRQVAAVGHNYTSRVTAPTCTERGFTTHTCRCGDSYVTDYTNPLGHSFTNYLSDGNATCTQDGTKTAVCDRCDATDTRIDVGSAHGHDFSDWAVVEEPTHTSDGLESRHCYHCGIEETRVIPRLENPFTDVPEDSFYHEPVLWAVANGITNGTSAETFGPEEQCMRAQVVTFLWRAAGSPEPAKTDNPFEDVKETDYFYKAVLWAVENGITNGISATHFGPTAYCNRAQVVTFLWRAQEMPEPSGTDMPFEDVDTGVWYEAPILWAVENGITNGMSATSFGINVICNRAQSVTFLYRTYN